MQKTTLFVAFVVMCYSCDSESFNRENGEKTHRSAFSKQEESATTVQTAVSKFTSFQYFIQSNGKIHSLHEQLMAAETGGVLKLCRAQTGARFSTGETIAQFETTPLRQQLEKAELAWFNGQKKYESQLLGYGNLHNCTG